MNEFNRMKYYRKFRRHKYYNPKFMILDSNVQIRYFNETVQVENNRYGYTEDDVLIHKIYIKNFPTSMKLRDFENFFSKFGNIIEFNLWLKFATIKHADNVSGFITFAKADSALDLILFYRDMKNFHCHDKLVLKENYSSLYDKEVEVDGIPRTTVLNQSYFYAYTREFFHMHYQMCYHQKFRSDELVRIIFGIFDINVKVYRQIFDHDYIQCWKISFDENQLALKTFDYFTHHIGSVGCAYSWFQPFYSTDNNDNNLSLFKLNYHCLHNILSKYLSLKDCMNLLKLSRKFEYAWPSMENFYFTSETVSKLTLMEILELLNTFGNKIHYFILNGCKFNYDCHKLLIEILRNCKNIKILKLQYLHIKPEFNLSKKLCTSLINAQYVSIQDCDITYNQLSNLINHLNITKLKLENTDTLNRYNNIILNENIISLKLYEDLDLKTYDKLFKNLFNLKELSIRFPSNLDTNYISLLIPKYCQLIESLNIYYSANSFEPDNGKYISELKLLINLGLYDIPICNNLAIFTFMNYIANSSISQTLETLTVQHDQHSSILTNNYVIIVRLLKHINDFKKLKILNIYDFDVKEFNEWDEISDVFPNSNIEICLRCFEMDYEIILQLIEILLERTEILNLKFETSLELCNYCDMTKDPIFIASQSDTKFDWDYHTFEDGEQVVILTLKYENNDNS